MNRSKIPWQNDKLCVKLVFKVNKSINKLKENLSQKFCLRIKLKDPVETIIVEIMSN